jgi:DNA-binding MarR family transcriptional regulator
MKNLPARSVSEAILDLIRRQDGQLSWHEIATEVGADAFVERGQISVELRALERGGAIRRRHGEGDARYWIV